MYGKTPIKAFFFFYLDVLHLNTFLDFSRSYDIIYIEKREDEINNFYYQRWKVF